MHNPTIVAYFDKENLQGDAAVLHAFSGEPLRTFVIAVSSLFVGVFISLFYMWPVSLMALALLPVLGFAAKIKVKNVRENTDEDASGPNDLENPDAITLLNMRTVAALNIEQIKREEYSDALRSKHPIAVRDSCVRGATGGLAQLAQFWSMALLYWWGGFLLSKYSDIWGFQDFLIAMFALIVSISGTALGSSGTTDKKVAEEIGSFL